MKTRNIYCILYLALFCAVLTLCYRPAGAPRDVLRLHILANSDSAADQAVKLLVRDAVLNTEGELLAAATNARDAADAAASRLAAVEQTAEAVLRENGFDYGAAASVGVSSFPDREYGGVLYPENDYTAVRVVLGDGVGENWWCLLFPPLCIGAADAGDTNDIEFKSLIGEWLNGGISWEDIFADWQP